MSAAKHNSSWKRCTGGATSYRNKNNMKTWRKHQQYKFVCNTFITKANMIYLDTLLAFTWHRDHICTTVTFGAPHCGNNSVAAFTLTKWSVSCLDDDIVACCLAVSDALGHELTWIQVLFQVYCVVELHWTQMSLTAEWKTDTSCVQMSTTDVDRWHSSGKICLQIC